MRFVRHILEVILHLLWPEDIPVQYEPTEPPAADSPQLEPLIIEPLDPEELIETPPIENDYLTLLFERKPITRYIDDLTIYAASIYYSGMRGIIHRFKYENAKSLCLPLGRAMSMLFTRPEADYLVPVPLHLNSTRKYNQSYELAVGMSDLWGIKILEAARWSGVIADRVGLNANERMKLRAEDFTVTRDVRGLRLAIVDDVCTTGTTLLRLSEALSNSGAIIVCAYALSAVSE